MAVVVQKTKDGAKKLTAVLVCPLCGNRMVVKNTYSNRRRYQCTNGNCKRVEIIYP